MSTEPTIDYDALATRFSDPEEQVRSAGHPRAARAEDEAGRAWLMREFGSAEAIDDATMPRGRRRVGAPAGPSPTVRGRISDDDYAAFQELAKASGRTQSELVREAVHRLLVEYRTAS